MIGDPTILTTLFHHSHYFGPSYSINNNTSSLQTVIAVLRMRHKSICQLCVSIGHKADASIIRVPKFLPPSLRRKIYQFNNLHGEEPNEPPRDCKRQPPAPQFKSRTSHPNTTPVVSYIMGRLNHHAIDNCDVEVHSLEFPVNFNYESVQDPGTT